VPVQRRRTNISNEKARLRYFLWMMVRKYQPDCYICHLPFIYDDALPARGTDNLTEHHLDGDHDNMLMENRCLVHRTCHKSFHTKDNIRKKKENRVLEDYR